MKKVYKKQLKRLVIIGAGGFGREVYVWAKQSKDNNSLWKIKGFVDDNRNALDGFKYDVNIISGIGEYNPKADDVFICAVGNVKLKKKLVSLILKKGGKFTNIIHPTAAIGENVSLGVGIVLCPYVVISSDATLGNFIHVNLHTSIGHDVRVGDWSFVGTGCALNGRVVLEDSVFMGGHVIVLPRGSIGKGAVVGSGSVVVGRVKPNVTVFGNPAKQMRFPKSIND
jgi:sugar O-acyltransferase (sialic acid O-acetyltransferase NeuD family)